MAVEVGVAGVAVDGGRGRARHYRGLNVSSGEHYAPGWLNFDLLPQRQLDLRADIFRLPFPAATFGKVYVGHTLEHLEWGDIPAALEELRRVLTPTGEIMVVGPDMDRARRTHQPTHILEAIEAHGDGPGGHQWTATGALTVEVCRSVFPGAAEVPVEIVDRPSWPNPSRAVWQCAVRCRP